MVAMPVAVVRAILYNKFELALIVLIARCPVPSKTPTPISKGPLLLSKGI
jgi:hypothetical protein